MVIMKLKYYLRGLGIGIMVTAAIMGISNRNAVKTAKAEVAAMYEQSADETSTQEESSAAETTEQSTSEPVIVRDEQKESEIAQVLDEAVKNEQGKEPESENESESVDNAQSESEDSDKADTDDNKQNDKNTVSDALTDNSGLSGNKDDDADMAGNGDTVNGNGISITISKGDDSGTAARKLYNAGLIENAAEYDAFLMQHGYDKKLSTGVKVIYPDDTWQEMAEKLVSK